MKMEDAKIIAIEREYGKRNLKRCSKCGRTAATVHRGEQCKEPVNYRQCHYCGHAAIFEWV